MQTMIYGASDDLIEVEGLISQEFSATLEDDALNYLGFSDGTVLSVQYTGGFWRVHRVAVGTASYTKTEATNEERDYSDRVVLDGDITWCVFGTHLERARDEPS